MAISLSCALGNKKLMRKSYSFSVTLMLKGGVSIRVQENIPRKYGTQYTKYSLAKLASLGLFE